MIRKIAIRTWGQVEFEVDLGVGMAERGGELVDCWKKGKVGKARRA